MLHFFITGNPEFYFQIVVALLSLSSFCYLHYLFLIKRKLFLKII